MEVIMEKNSTDLINWHELSRYNELSHETQEALRLLVNTLASYKEDDYLQESSRQELDKLRIKITYFEDTL